MSTTGCEQHARSALNAGLGFHPAAWQALAARVSQAAQEMVSAHSAVQQTQRVLKQHLASMLPATAPAQQHHEAREPNGGVGVEANEGESPGAALDPADADRLYWQLGHEQRALEAAAQAWQEVGECLQVRKRQHWGAQAAVCGALDSPGATASPTRRINTSYLLFCVLHCTALGCAVLHLFCPVRPPRPVHTACPPAPHARPTSFTSASCSSAVNCRAACGGGAITLSLRSLKPP